MSNKSIISIFTVVTVVLVMLGCSITKVHDGDASPVKLTDRSQACCLIVYPNDCSLSARTAGKLSDYIEGQSDIRPLVCPDDKFTIPHEGTAIIIIDGTKNHRLTSKWNIKVHINSDRDDAYNLKVLRQDKFPLIIAAGNGPNGAKYATYRLMEELSVENKQISVLPMDIKAEPFIKTRSVSLFNTWICPIDIMRRYNIEAWPVEKIENYIDMYDFLGFNAIETHDRFNEGYLKPCYGVTRQQWRNKVVAICDRAHINGQTVFLRGWGNAVMNVPDDFKPEGPTSRVPMNMLRLCPDRPTEGPLWNNWQREIHDYSRWQSEIVGYYVNNYAGHIDHFIAHWADPGGCSNATVKDAMLMHMELHNAFKKLDPKFESTFNLWFMAKKKPPYWPGYKDHHSVCDAGVLDKEICISQGNKGSMLGAANPYSEMVTNDIQAAGHPAAVWNWYLADVETYGG